MAQRRFASIDEGAKAAAFVIELGSKQRLDDYLRRGRALASMSEAAMEIAFVTIFEALAEDPGRPAARALSDDLLAEYEVRGSTPPYRSHPDLMRDYFSAFQNVVDGMTAAEKAEVDRRFWEDYDAGKAAAN